MLQCASACCSVLLYCCRVLVQVKIWEPSLTTHLALGGALPAHAAQALLAVGVAAGVVVVGAAARPVLF